MDKAKGGYNIHKIWKQTAKVEAWLRDEKLDACWSLVCATFDALRAATRLIS